MNIFHHITANHSKECRQLLWTVNVVLVLLVVTASNARAEDPFTIALVKYEGGGDWYTGPTSLPNLLRFIRDNAGIKTISEPPVVSLNDPRLFNYPIIYMNGHGNVSFSESDVLALRRYLAAGGFLFANDDYGMDKSFRREMLKVIPDAKFVELPFSHPLYHSDYDFPNGAPKIHEHDNLPPQGLGLFMDGRLVVFYDYQADLGDGWEDPDVHHDPEALRQAALKMGTNVIVWRLRGGE